MIGARGGTVAGMCGRFTSVTRAGDVARYFAVDQVMVPDLGPRYNVAPTQDVYAVARHADETRLGCLRWGLVPPWAEDVRVGSRMINARAETLARRGAFRRAFAHRRCLVPADGFYEWTKTPGSPSRQAWYLLPRRPGPLALAGLWESWTGQCRPDGPTERVVSVAIVTTAANGVLAPLHDRMPAVLEAAHWEEWLDGANEDTDRLARMLVPAPEDLLEARPVRPLVNQVANDGPELIEATATGVRA